MQCRQARHGLHRFPRNPGSYRQRQDGYLFFTRWREAEGCCWRTHSKLCIADAYPVTEGHSLVIPRRHVADGLELHHREWNAVVELLKRRKEQLAAQDPTISGWNVGLNSGEAAGQTVFHAHWYLIPRRDGDCEQPRGDVRGVIAERQGIDFVTNEPSKHLNINQPKR